MSRAVASGATVYEACKAMYVDAHDASSPSSSQSHEMEYMLRCVGTSNAKSIDVFFLIYASSLVFFMQAGFAMLCAGCVQLKNVQNSMLKNLLDACGAALGFYSLGYAFAYGGMDYADPNKTFVGTTNFFLVGVEDLLFWLFQFAFAASSATIVAGTLAERCQMAAYLCYSLTLTGFVYPVVAHSVWSPQGFLNAEAVNPLWGVGVLDFAGSMVVHLTGGATALIATYLLGPRRGRFYDHRGDPLEVPKEFPGHSQALQMLGAFILWFGWYGFNTGSALSITSPHQVQVVSLVAVNTTLAAASACVAALGASYVHSERTMGEGTFSLTYAMNGTLGGLVSITGACGTVEPWAAVIIGFAAGMLYLATSKLLVRLRIDDAVDAVPVHMTNGIWGSIAVGLFASPDRIELAYGEVGDSGVFAGGNGTLLGCQCVGVLFVIGWVTLIMFPFFCLLNYMGWLRASASDEVEGLDSRYHSSSTKFDTQVGPTSHYGQNNLRLRRTLDAMEDAQYAHYGQRNRRLRRTLDAMEEFEKSSHQHCPVDDSGMSENIQASGAKAASAPKTFSVATGD
eukprot:CAMPEP_0172538840 /NCGR_PEP_ID=MMETSP1067-20121228/10157_1 /TAXON_ID=265564 ORGANISM="Thalassiosira punctigera, Strain Tpunct2005C2" /NCGR_SAMPLE_ID=MMETSP1067 /ASSEMBLY_ACC=CAM_ASM_000444 /LENGTH=567 /DNA_ID=CAMNT_0013324423 /DNA_START=38 /DNA_END=1741 /DNA_ORIENTATION=-